MKHEKVAGFTTRGKDKLLDVLLSVASCLLPVSQVVATWILPPASVTLYQSVGQGHKRVNAQPKQMIQQRLVLNLSWALQVFKAKGLRHPSAGLHLSAGATFIPNDIQLGGTEAPFIILTGPKHGGYGPGSLAPLCSDWNTWALMEFVLKSFRASCDICHILPQLLFFIVTFAVRACHAGAWRM